MGPRHTIPLPAAASAAAPITARPPGVESRPRTVANTTAPIAPAPSLALAPNVNTQARNPGGLCCVRVR